jgi:Ran GTPase-activating protein (RanGAP) involved in mRNA processing and transport
VTFDDGEEEAFMPASLMVPVKGVLLLDGDGALALLRHCGGTSGAADAFGAVLADAANAGLYQATHLSLQESECAEAFSAAALLGPEGRLRRAGGLFKWFNSTADATAILNDGWYLGTLRLVRAPAAADEAQQLALGRAVLGEWTEEGDGALALKGFAGESVTATGVQALLSLVRAFGRVVKGLDFGQVFADGPEAVAALGVALREGACPELRELDIGDNKAGAEGVAALCEALREGACPELRELDIRFNDAGSAGVAALGEALRAGACPELRKLNIRDNKAGAEGVAALCEALREGACPELRELSIDRNNAGAEGVAALGVALRAGACPELRELEIRFNDAGAAGVAALGEALRAGACPELRRVAILPQRRLRRQAAMVFPGGSMQHGPPLPPAATMQQRPTWATCPPRARTSHLVGTYPLPTHLYPRRKTLCEVRGRPAETRRRG